MVIEKFFQFKHKTIISKLIPYGFSLLSFVFVTYLLVSALNYFFLNIVNYFSILKSS